MKLIAALAIALCTRRSSPRPPQAAPRVAALTPFAASTITRLGVRPVVIGQTLGGTDQYLASLRGVPVLTLTHPLGPNLEQLATYNPSIVLSSKTWQRGSPAMRRLGMKVYETDPTSVAAVGRETRAIGSVLGRTRAANALATQDRGRRRRRQARHHAPPARARDPRRRPHALRDARELVGRRRRRPGRRAPAHRRG